MPIFRIIFVLACGLSHSACLDTFMPDHQKNEWIQSPMVTIADQHFSSLDLSKYEISVLIPVYREHLNGNLLRTLRDLDRQDRGRIHVFIQVNNTRDHFVSKSETYLDNLALKNDLQNPESAYHAFKNIEIYWQFKIEENAPEKRRIGLRRRDLEDSALAVVGNHPHHIVQHLDADTRLAPYFVKHLLARYENGVDAVISGILPRVTEDNLATDNLLALSNHYSTHAAAYSVINQLARTTFLSPLRVSLRASVLEKKQLRMTDDDCGEDAHLLMRLRKLGMAVANNWSAPVIFSFRAREDGYDAATYHQNLTKESTILSTLRINNFALQMNRAMHELFDEYTDLPEVADELAHVEQKLRLIMPKWSQILRQFQVNFSSIPHLATADQNLRLQHSLESWYSIIGYLHEFRANRVPSTKHWRILIALNFLSTQLDPHIPENIQNVIHEHRRIVAIDLLSNAKIDNSLHAFLNQMRMPQLYNMNSLYLVRERIAKHFDPRSPIEVGALSTLSDVLRAVDEFSSSYESAYSCRMFQRFLPSFSGELLLRLDAWSGREDRPQPCTLSTSQRQAIDQWFEEITKEHPHPFIARARAIWNLWPVKDP